MVLMLRLMPWKFSTTNCKQRWINRATLYISHIAYTSIITTKEMMLVLMLMFTLMLWKLSVVWILSKYELIRQHSTSLTPACWCWYWCWCVCWCLESWNHAMDCKQMSNQTTLYIFHIAYTSIITTKEMVLMLMLLLILNELIRLHLLLSQPTQSWHPTSLALERTTN